VLLYIHGFESSPASLKAQQLQQFLAQHQAPAALLPQLPATMAAAKSMLDELIEQQPITAVMGSSLGGFWSHYVASRLAQQQRPARAVLINPAVAPQHWMPEHPIQRIHPCTHESYQLDAGDKQVLQQVEQQLDSALELLILLQRSDEQLDYRQAQNFYQSQRMIVESGGDHSFVDFPRYLPAALEFLSVL